MKKITTFYHYWIPDDFRALFWYWWMDEQLDAIKQSKLYQVSDIQMHICMPIYWNTDPRGIQFQANKTLEPVLFIDKVEEYIKHKYPWVNTTYYDLTPEHQFEGHTLVPLWEHAKQNPDQYVVYVHAKGVCSSSPQVKMWRETLNTEMITKWPERVSDMTDAQVLAVKDSTVRIDDTEFWTHASGNFFWANTDYIAGLQKPIYPDRYDYERWITSRAPEIKFVLDTNTDHFSDYYGD
jgi:hypothetical protein